jgi:hypothetical protein
MLDTRKQWFRDFPWEMVVEKNQTFCKNAELAPQPGRSYKTACELWEKHASQALTLGEALEICRQCHELAPFRFYNSPTFAALARLLLTEFTNALPGLEAEMVRNTASHYVAGLISRKELISVFGFFDEPGALQRSTFRQRLGSFFRIRKPSSPDPEIERRAPVSPPGKVRSPEVSGK